jgi:hypothetical protein
MYFPFNAIIANGKSRPAHTLLQECKCIIGFASTHTIVFSQLALSTSAYQFDFYVCLLKIEPTNTQKMLQN